MGLDLSLFEVCDAQLDSAFQTMRGDPAATTGTVLIWGAKPKAPCAPIASQWTAEASVLFEPPDSSYSFLVCFHISFTPRKTKEGGSPRALMQEEHSQRQRCLGSPERAYYTDERLILRSTACLSFEKIRCISENGHAVSTRTRIIGGPRR